MGYQSLPVNMTPELFECSIKASPKEAIKELIWNSCDADAKNIEISFEIDMPAAPRCARSTPPVSAFAPLPPQPIKRFFYAPTD